MDSFGIKNNNNNHLHHQQQQKKVSSSKPPTIPSKFNFSLRGASTQNVKLKNKIDISHLIDIPKRGVRPVSSNNTSANSNSVCSQEEISVISAIESSSNVSRLHTTLNCSTFSTLNSTLRPVKPPRISEDDIWECKFTSYLQEQLLNSLLNEEERITKDIIADEEIMLAINRHFDKREVGMILAKNEAIHFKLSMIEMCERLNNCLQGIARLSGTNVDSVVTKLASKLSETINLLPIINCTYDNERQIINWKELSSVAKKLNLLLTSKNKPFHYIKSLSKSIENIENELGLIQLKRKRQIVLNQKLTFLASLRLCAQLHEKHELRMKDEILPSYVRDSSFMITEEFDYEKGISNESVIFFE